MSLRLKLTTSLLLFLTGINLLIYAHTIYLGVYLGTTLMVAGVLLPMYDPKCQWQGVSAATILRAALAPVLAPFRRLSASRAPVAVTPDSTQGMAPGVPIPPATILKFIISAVLLLVGTNMNTDDRAAARARMEMSRHMRDLTLVFVEREDPSAVDVVSRSLAKASFPKATINRSRFVLPSMVLIIVGLFLPFVRFGRAVPPAAQSATSS